MAGMLWVTDRDADARLFFRQLVPEAEVLTPEDLTTRIRLGQRPDGLVIDGTQLLELAPDHRTEVLALPRVLICTGMLLASMPMNLISGPGVAVLAKPFCIEDLEAGIEWIRGASGTLRPEHVPFGVLVQRRRPRHPRGRRLTP